MKTIGRIEIHAPVGTNVRIDERPMAWGPGDVLEVEPGAHRVDLQVAGETKRLEARCDAGQVVTVSWAEEHVVVGPPQTRTESYRPATGWIVPGVVGGLGLVGVGLGIGFGVASSSAATDAKNSAASGICAAPSAACDTFRDHANNANSAATASIIGYVGGGVLMGAAVVMAIVWPSKQRDVVVAPTASAQGGGLMITGRF